MTEAAFFSGDITLVLLVIALGIFAWLTTKSRKTRSFQFQISVFIVIWIAGEIVDLLGEEGIIQSFASEEIGMYVHVLAMGMFSAMLWIRFYLSKKSAKTMAETFQES